MGSYSRIRKSFIGLPYKIKTENKLLNVIKSGKDKWVYFTTTD